MRDVIFEDKRYTRYLPIACLRPTFGLRCGRTTLAEKIVRQCPGAEAVYFLRPELKDVFAETTKAPINDASKLAGDDLLVVNGRLLALAGALSADGPEERAACCQTLVWARVKKARVNAWKAQSIEDLVAKISAEIPQVEKKFELIRYPWDLIHHNPAALVDDFKAFGKTGILCGDKMSDQAAIWGPKDQLYIAASAEIQPHVTLDTTLGPIHIEEGVKIQAHTRVEGPCWVGEKSLLVGGKIREGCSIGPVCRVGGEVEESIIHGYSNKYHDGFLGHAYVCEWVNLGALTTNSDLKNDYSNVQIYCEGELKDTGSPKVGSFIADHTKTSIGTCLNTGTVVGVACNVVGVGHLAPKYVPSFTMFVQGRLFKVGFKSQMDTARTAMGRRKKELTAAQEALLEKVFEATKEERKEAVRKSGK